MLRTGSSADKAIVIATALFLPVSMFKIALKASLLLCYHIKVIRRLRWRSWRYRQKVRGQYSCELLGKCRLPQQKSPEFWKQKYFFITQRFTGFFTHYTFIIYVSFFISTELSEI
jgi:hypothetical protein